MKTTFALYLQLLFLILFAGEVVATTFYVAPVPIGSDSNTGSNSSPWATFDYALTKIKSGDTLIVKAGIYNQAIKVLNKSNITIQGEIDRDGNRQSILDLTTPITGWVRAPEIHKYVWKIKDLGYRPSAMSVIADGDSYSLVRLCNPKDEDPVNEIKIAYCTSKLNTHLKKPPNAIHESKYAIPVSYWDGIEAQFFSPSDNLTYIRFRNGDDPNKKIIKAMESNFAVRISGGSNITIKNFNIKAGSQGIVFQSFIGIPPKKITIDNNEIYNGGVKIKATLGNDHIIKNNILYQKAYSTLKDGYSFGSWDCSLADNECSYQAAVHEHQYTHYKYNTGWADAIRGSGGMLFAGGGSGNIIHKNTVIDMVEGVFLGINNYEFYENVIYDLSSIGINFIGGHSKNAKIFKNFISNAASNIRLNEYEKGIGPIYIYNNHSLQPHNIGRHMFWHHSGAGENPPIITETWIYHNSFSGGRGFYQVNNSNKWNNSTLKKTYLVNNIISGPRVDGGKTTYRNGSSWIGACSNNWISGNFTPIGNWCDSLSNINSGTILMWETDIHHNFNISDSRAKKSGIDISRSFIINEVLYDALPGFEAGYSDLDGRPDMGASYSQKILTAPKLIKIKYAD